MTVVLLSCITAVTVVAQSSDHCLTEEIYQRQLGSNPALKELRDAAFKLAMRMKDDPSEQGNAVKYIPLVFHIMHEGKGENISKAQILDQVRILNEDFRRLNADTVNTPGPFKPLGSDTQIEFRLAQIDPNGNCTDGIVRVFTPLTNGADDAVKALSYWDADKYLNFWVVKTIYNFTGSGGTIIGYAYYPGTAPNGADGVIIRSDHIGSIGTAVGANDNGRVSAHEIGHYLDLAHVWGDSFCGDDFVADTPTSAGPNYGCAIFPRITCSNGPDGDMFSNYMDYSNGSCQNIFTHGQKSRMDATFLIYRDNLISPSNHISTGIFNLPSACTMVPEFYANVTSICAGGTIDFSDASWNGTATVRNWSFPGGNPSSSTAQNPIITYPTPGLYDVILNVGNAAGNVSSTRSGYITVLASSGDVNTSYYESFENTGIPTGFEVINEGGAGFESTVGAAATGVSSFKVDNFTFNMSGTRDIFYTPTFDFSQILQPQITFKVAHAGVTGSSTDNLRVSVSPDCGESWSIRYNKTGSALNTAPPTNSPFVPIATEWRTENVILPTSLFFANKPNVRFRFEYSYVDGNNLYIDDINIIGLTGIENNFRSAGIIYPNPGNGKGVLKLNTALKSDSKINVFNSLGEVVFKSNVFPKGISEIPLDLNLAPGMYYIRILNKDYSTPIKLIIKND